MPLTNDFTADTSMLCEFSPRTKLRAVSCIELSFIDAKLRRPKNKNFLIHRKISRTKIIAF